MSVREYIGARYVPVFAEPAEWTNERTYEPLTIVLHEGNSYTSRQYVPAGIDIANETFWAETGNYNAQVEAYRQEVLRYEDAINQNKEQIAQLQIYTRKIGHKFEGSNVVWVGDSWSVDDRGTPNLPTRFCNYAHANLVANVSRSGSGWVGQSIAGAGTFISRFTEWVNSYSGNLEEIDYVITFGSINDGSQEVNGAYSNFRNYVKSKLPNATWIAIPTFGTFYQNIFSYSNHTLGTYPVWCANISKGYAAASTYADIAIPGTQYILCNAGNTAQQDELHPNANGIEFIAKFLISYLVYGIWNVPPLHINNIDNVLTWWYLGNAKTQITNYAISCNIPAPNQLVLNGNFGLESKDHLKTNNVNATFLFGLPFTFFQNILGNASWSLGTAYMLDSNGKEVMQGKVAPYGQGYSYTASRDWEEGITSNTLQSNGWLQISPKFNFTLPEDLKGNLYFNINSTFV